MLRVTGTLTPEFSPTNFEDLAVPTFVEDTSTSNLYNQLFWLAIAFAATLCLTVRPRALFSALRSVWFLPVLIVFCVLSFVWATHPGISFRRSLLLAIGAYSAVISVVYCRNSNDVLRTIYLALGLALILNASTLAFPFSFDSRGLFRGAIGDKNFLGYVAALGLAIGVTWGTTYSSIRMRFVNFFYIAGWALIIVITGAKTSLALCVVAPLAVIILTQIVARLHLALHASMLLSAVVLSVLLPFLIYGLGLGLEAIVGIFVSDVSFTGRDVIWQFIFEQLEGRWLSGFGYGSFWGVGLDAPNLRAEYQFIRILTQAHNGYLDVLLTLGPFGLILTLGFLFQTVVFIGKIRTLNKPLYQFSLFVVVFILVHNLTDSNLVRGISCLWIVLIVIAYASAKQYRLHSTSREPKTAYAFA